MALQPIHLALLLRDDKPLSRQSILQRTNRLMLFFQLLLKLRCLMWAIAGHTLLQLCLCIR